MKYTNCDLHVHSNNSDGSLSTSELIAEAKKLGIIIALTDHNTTKGLESFLKEASEQGITVVSGIELSTEYNGKELHLLGYFIDKEHYEKIEKLMEEYHTLKEESNIALTNRLRENGYIIDYEDVKKRNVNGHSNRAHFASELMEKGYISSIEKAFETILSVKNGLYVPPKRMNIFDAIRFLCGINAVPVLAHPLIDLDENELRELLPKAINAGLVGIETMHSKYSEDDLKTAEQISKDFNLLQSGGSDFHGKPKPNVFLGVGKGNLSIPVEFYYKLLAVKMEKESKESC